MPRSTCSSSSSRTSASTGRTPSEQTQSFANKDVVVGTTWQYQYLTLTAENEPIAAPGPAGGPVPPPRRGGDGLVGHLDDQLGGRASELHVPVDGLHRLAAGEL